MPGDALTVLVVDDESAIREVLETRLSAWGYDVVLAGDAAEARARVKSDPDLVLCDVALPDANGVELVEALRQGHRPVVMMTAYGSIDVAVESMKQGATDFLTKPLDQDKLRATLDRLAEGVRERRQPSVSAAEGGAGWGGLVGNSAPMRSLYALLQRLARAGAPVLVAGESGTGKEVVARALHDAGPRKDGPFVALNMAALPAGIVESELFGHARGSFTGAVTAREGAFQQARGGTLFLDEITEMPVELQPKLLRALEDGSFRPIGGRDEQKADVRIIAATNRDPAGAVASGRLRQDLYYRLDVLTVKLPPLRDRREDVPLLVRHFLQRLAERGGLDATPPVDGAVFERLASHDWPGNVRELRNVVERAWVLSGGGRISLEHLPETLRPAPSEGASLPVDGGATAAEPVVVLPANVTAAEAERILVLETLKQVGHNKAAAARRLGMDVKTIRNKLRAWGLSPGGE